VRGKLSSYEVTDADLRTLLADRVAAVRGRIAAACARAGRDPAEVTLVAVTKTVSPRVAAVMPELGVSDLGENRPQELWRKAEALKPLPVRWHLIGHLQRNKVERTLPLVHLIHSIDSVRLALAVAIEGRKRGIRARVLLEVNTSGEEQKHGFRPDELKAAVPELACLPLDINGLMGMAAYSDDPQRARPAFAELRHLSDRFWNDWVMVDDRPRDLSMGMSGDFEVAIEEGATLVRIGTTLFEGLDDV
jgi:pyridoxal phosphate enzyme (YggS family)